MGGVGSLLRAVPPVASLRGLAVVALAIVVAYPSLAFARDPLKFIAVLSEAVSRLGVDDTREIRRTTLCKGVSPDVASRPVPPDLDLEESFGGI